MIKDDFTTVCMRSFTYALTVRLLTSADYNLLLLAIPGAATVVKLCAKSNCRTFSKAQAVLLILYSSFCVHVCVCAHIHVYGYRYWYVDTHRGSYRLKSLLILSWQLIFRLHVLWKYEVLVEGKPMEESFWLWTPTTWRSAVFCRSACLLYSLQIMPYHKPVEVCWWLL